MPTAGATEAIQGIADGRGSLATQRQPQDAEKKTNENDLAAERQENAAGNHESQEFT